MTGPEGWVMHPGNEKSPGLVDFRTPDNKAVMGLQALNKRLSISLLDYAKRQATERQKVRKAFKVLASARIKADPLEIVEVLYEVTSVSGEKMNTMESYFYDSKRGIIYALTVVTPLDQYVQNQKILDVVVKSVVIK